MQSLAPELIDLEALPCIPFAERGRLPHVPGIYFVLNAEKELLYIGQARSLSVRWQNHHRHAEFSNLPSLSIAYLLVTEMGFSPPQATPFEW